MTPLRAMGTTERNTFTFSNRMLSASNAAGTSIAVRVSNWVRWFCTMSRNAPASS